MQPWRYRAIILMMLLTAGLCAHITPQLEGDWNILSLYQEGENETQSGDNPDTWNENESVRGDYPEGEEDAESSDGDNQDDDSDSSSADEGSEGNSGLGDGDGSGGDDNAAYSAEGADAPPSNDIAINENADSSASSIGGMPWMPPPIVMVALLSSLIAVGIFSTLAVGIVTSEVTRTGLLLAFAGPLIAMMAKGEGGTFTRGRILGYVEAHPGIHFSALRDALVLANGVVAHHLHTLEKEGKVISWTDGKKRRFASNNINPKELKQVKSPVTGMQHAILEILAEKGEIGITSGELQEKLSTSRQLMSYHLQRLDDRELVNSKGRGRKKRWEVSMKGGQHLNERAAYLSA